MAVIVQTKDPAALLAAIQSKIANKNLLGSIRQWHSESHADDAGGPPRLTCIDDSLRMNRAAWFLPKLEADRVIFLLVAPAFRLDVPRNVHATYHRLFIRMLMEHFYHLISDPIATPQPIRGESRVAQPAPPRTPARSPR